MTRACKASIKPTTGKKRESATASAIAHTTAAACQKITRQTLSILKLCARRAVCANLLVSGKCSESWTNETHAVETADRHAPAKGWKRVRSDVAECRGYRRLCV